MERLARKIASNIAGSLDYDDEKERVIAYGLTAMLQVAVTVILVFSIGLLVGAPVEALIICFSVSILRKYSGGAHAGTIEECISISVIYCVVFALISRRLLLPVLNTYSMLFIIIVVYALSFIAIFKLAPVDSPNKPIKTDKKKRRMRRGSFITLSVYFVLSILFLLLSLKYHNRSSLGISLLFGIIWQIFTLTKFGFYFLKKIDFGVNNIFRNRREVDRL
jgi:accessory gene regulator B